MFLRCVLIVMLSVVFFFVAVFLVVLIVVAVLPDNGAALNSAIKVIGMLVFVVLIVVRVLPDNGAALNSAVEVVGMVFLMVNISGGGSGSTRNGSGRRRLGASGAAAEDHCRSGKNSYKPEFFQFYHSLLSYTNIISPPQKIAILF